MGDTPLGLKLLGLDMADGPVCGRLADVDDQGRAWVEFAGSAGRVNARCVVPEAALPAREALHGASVLLVFEDHDPARPIIVGFVRDRLWTSGSEVREAVAPVSAKVIIEGEEELVLRCGQGSISMTADGRIVIKGTRLVSQARETNKVRGAAVLIN